MFDRNPTPLPIKKASLPQRIKHISIGHEIYSKKYSEQTVSLDKLQEHEQLLWEIKDCDINLSHQIDQYWNLDFSTTIEELCKEPQLNKIIRTAIVVEMGAISLLSFSVKHASLWEVVKAPLQRLMANIHQTFLFIIDLILSRVPAESLQNEWVFTLQNTLLQKRTKKLSKRESFLHVKHFSESSFKTVKALIQDISIGKQFTSELLKVMSSIDKVVLKTARMQIKKLTNKLIAKSFFLPSTKKEYTLVVDMEQTLTLDRRDTVKVRPYAKEFLQDLNGFYELVIYLSGEKEKDVEKIDTDRIVNNLLFKDSAGDLYIKDLKKLGKSLNSVVSVDVLGSSFQMSVENSLFVSPWNGDKNDLSLKQLADLLIGIAEKKPKDIRVPLKKYRDQYLQQIANGVELPLLIKI